MIFPRKNEPSRFSGWLGSAYVGHLLGIEILFIDVSMNTKVVGG